MAQARLKLIRDLGRHRASMPDTWLKLAVELAMAALYAEEIGDDKWITTGTTVPTLERSRIGKRNVKSATR